MPRTLPRLLAAAAIVGSLAACTDPYDPGQRAVGGGLVGAGVGAAAGGLLGGGRGALAGGLLGGATGAVVGGVTTPTPPPPQPYYGGGGGYERPRYYQ